MPNKYYLTLITALGIGTLSYAQQTTVIQQSSNLTTIDFTTGTYNLITNGGFTMVEDEETSPILELGAPALGKYAFSVALPASGAASVEVEEGSYVEYPGIDIKPSKGSLKRNIDPSTVALTYGDAYTTNAFYPSVLATIYDPFIFRTVRGASIHVFPYRYNPVTKVLRVYKNMRIKVKTDATKSGMNELTSLERDPANMEATYENLFVNYKQAYPQMRYTNIGETGRMLIITDPAFSSALTTLAAWKEQRGIETEIVTTTTTGTTASAINTYIQNYYTANPTTKFVLFVGDHEFVPAYNAGSTGSETKWSDSYYGFITGTDVFPEVFIGRLPAKTLAHATSMVSKILEYEKTPSAGTWYTTSIGIASDEGAGIGDDGEADWQHMRNIRTELMGFGYTTVHEFYDASHGGADASGNPTSSMVATQVNAGASLFLYCGHGDLTSCVTSNYSISNVNAATNNGKYPFVVSVACNNGTFVGGECLTEVFMRASNSSGPTGAIAACGSSILMAWAQPMETEDEISKILSEISTNEKHTLGGLFYNGQMSMIADYPTGSGPEVMETWIMFGDPTVMIRSKVPASMSVSNPSCYSNGASFTVTGGIDGADVTLTQGNTILASGKITGSSVTLNPTGATTGSATLTVSGYNQLPYIVTVAECVTGIKEINAFDMSVYPNPATDVLMTDGGQGLNYTISDASGRTVSTGINTGTIEIAGISQGMYVIKFTNGEGENFTTRFIKK